MNQIELLDHVLGNLKAGNAPTKGLSFGELIKLQYSLSSIVYTLAPRTHKVNGFDVPAPESEELECDTDYFIPSLDGRDFYSGVVWSNHQYDVSCLNRGLVHLTKEAAIANAKAMCGIDPEAEIEE